MTVMHRLARAGWRQFVLLSAMAFFALLVTRNLAHWQVTEHAALAQEAARTFDQLVPVTAPRGNILDSASQPLVTSDMVYTLHVDPSTLVKRRAIAVAALMPILHQDRATLERKLTYRPAAPSAKYVPLADGLDGTTIAAVRKLGLPGMIIASSSRAHYLNGKLAAPLLGFVSKAGYGQYGIEQAFNKILRGQDGAELNLANTSTRQLPPTARPRPYVPGADIVLTINATIQQVVETRLQETIDHTHARGGTAIVMDPKTGAILAMASLPSYDPNAYSLVKDPSLFNNRAIQTYQPGSTFKVISVATGFDTGAFNPDTIVNDTGIFQDPHYGDVPIHNWEPRGWGPETPEIMLRHSANVGMVQFVQKINPPQTYYDYLIKHFGFTKSTGIGLIGEEIGAVRQPVGGHWQQLDLLVNSYGQSIDVTPLQLVTAMGALANNGKRMRPYLVQKIVYPGGRTWDEHPKVAAQAVSPATAATITRVLHQSGLSADLHDDNPLGNSEATCALTNGFPVAAKTGTTMPDVSASGAVDLSRGTIASLLGFAPIDNPRFVMLVTVDHPQRLSTDNPQNSHIYGSVTAGPTWHDIAERLYQLMRVAPAPNYPDPIKEDIPRFQGAQQGWGCEFNKPNQP